MTIAGLVVTILGFAMAVAGLGMTDSTSTRMIMALVGIAVSLFGILGIINREAQKNAIWRK